MLVQCGLLKALTMFSDPTARHQSFMQALKDQVEAHIDIPPLEIIAVLSQLVGNVSAAYRIEPSIFIEIVLESIKQGNIESCFASIRSNDNEKSD